MNRGQSENIEDHKDFSKFLIKLQPKILCILDITSRNNVNLLASAFVRCPGPNIVSGSPQQLLTLHSDGLLRVWNVDDGRCVLVSHNSLFKSAPLGMTALNDYPGIVAVVGSEADVYIINFYTMTLLNKLNLQFKGYTSI